MNGSGNNNNIVNDNNDIVNRNNNQMGMKDVDATVGESYSIF